MLSPYRAWTYGGQAAIRVAWLSPWGGKLLKNANGLLYAALFRPAVECSLHEWSDAIWTLRRGRYGRLLRIGTAKCLVYSRLRRILCARLGLRLSSRGVAVWFGGSGVVDNRSAAVVGCTQDAEDIQRQ